MKQLGDNIEIDLDDIHLALAALKAQGGKRKRRQHYPAHLGRKHTALIETVRPNKINQTITKQAVEFRLLRACMTLRALPDNREQSWLRVRACWPEYETEYKHTEQENEYRERFIPEPSDISDMDIALGWLGAISRMGKHEKGYLVRKQMQKTIWLRSAGFSFEDIGSILKKAKSTANYFYKDGILFSWKVANGIAQVEKRSA